MLGGQSTQKGRRVREDIQAAYARLDAAGQASINGLRAMGPVKKAFQKLDEFLTNERVLALAAAMDPVPAGAGMRDIVAAGNSWRLLVLTEMNFWEVRSSGRLNGNRPEGARYALGSLQDVRWRSERPLAKMGAKQRYLMIDHLRGAMLETEMYSLKSDSELEVMGRALQEQVGLVHEAIAEQEQRERAPVVVQQSSVADELAKLAQLRDSGVLTDAEFQQQKAKMLT